MTKKNLYVVPTTNTLEVKIQGVIMQSGRYGAKGAAGADLVNSDSEYDL